MDIFFPEHIFLADVFGWFSSPQRPWPPARGHSAFAVPWQEAPGAGNRAGAVGVSVWLVNLLSVGFSFWFGRFDTWLSSHLKLPPSYLLSYSGNYTDDAKSWRLVDITRLTSKYQHDRADKRICTSLLKTRTCSLERALRRTHRFQKWLRAKRLTPDLVQVCAPQSPCPPPMGEWGALEGLPCGFGVEGKGSEGGTGAICQVEGQLRQWLALFLPWLAKGQPCVTPAKPTARGEK